MAEIEAVSYTHLDVYKRQHFEEGKSAPEVRKKQKKIPKVTFSIMDADVQTLIDYIGGTNAVSYTHLDT